MRNMLPVVWLMILTVGTAHADELRAAFVDGVVEIKASVREGTNVWPWDFALTKRHNKERKDKKGLEEILVSNSCGFGEGVYSGFMSTAESPQRVKARFLKGEFCRLREFVFDGPTILILREWNRKFYIIDSVPLYSGEGRELFVVSGDFIRRWELSSIAEDVSEKVCFERENLSDLEQEQLLSDKNSITFESTICFRSGVTAQRIVEKFSNKTMQFTCEPQAGSGCLHR